MKSVLEVIAGCLLVGVVMLFVEHFLFGTATSWITLPFYFVAGMVVGATHSTWCRWLPWNSR